jgi:hypothetical protein
VTDYKKRGTMETLFDKYTVTKKFGKTDPNAKYFVLRIDTDVHARKALAAYIKSILPEEPEYARQLAKWLCSAIDLKLSPWTVNKCLNDTTDRQMILLAEGILLHERPFTTREWCGADKPFSGAQFSRLREEMVKDEMLVMSSEKDVRRGFVLTDYGRAMLGYFL